MPRVLTRLKISEVSSVDRGAGEGVKILLMKNDDEPYWKRGFSTEERQRDAKSGAAESDGSFPIHNSADLHNAMRAIGRSKNPEKTRAHIRARARALGLTSELSDSFKRHNMGIFAKIFGRQSNDAVIDKSVEGLAKSVVSILNDDKLNEDEGTAALSKTFEQFSEHLKSNLTGDLPVAKKESDMDISVLRKALGLADAATEADVTAAIAKSMTVAADAAKSVKKMQQELLISKADFSEAELDYYHKISEYDEEEEDREGGNEGRKGKKKSFREATHSQRAEMMKGDSAVPEWVKKLMEQNEALTKRLDSLEGSGNLQTLAKRAADHGLAETEAETLAKAYKGDAAAVDKLLGFVKAAAHQAKLGGVFKEFGSSTGNGVSDSPYDQLLAKAEELRKRDPKLSQAQAFAKVYEDPANAALVKNERAENGVAA